MPQARPRRAHPGLVLPALLSTLMMVTTMLIFSDPVTAADEKRFERTVTVQASGHASAEPDMAHISTGVVSEAATAREALTRNSETMKGVIAGLKTLGIDARDIQTQSMSVEPRYPASASSGGARSVPQIAGYRVVNQLLITSRNLDRIGEVLDQLVTLGANQMGGLSFEVSRAEVLRDDARKEAVANALRRAKLFAAAAGAEVGQVLAIAEDVGGGGRPMLMGRAAMESAVPIERGTQTLEARVTVTWALK